MKKIIYFSIFLTLFILNTNSVEIGLEGGISSLSYAEVGVNNKDDLYTLNSYLIGVSLKKNLDYFNLKVSLKTQLPYSLTFTDALGTDDKNYMEDLMYFGGNLQVFLLFPVIKDAQLFSPGLFLNYDIIYLKDNMIGYDDLYLFSVMGAGPGAEFLVPINSFLMFSINASWAFNFLPINNRPGELKWSNNFLLSFSIILK